MPSTETVSHLLSRVRERLDEALDPETNFWTDHELTEYTNEGLREVHQTMREAHESWFVRTLRSDAGLVGIAGRTYDTERLAFQTGRNEIPLPPDFAELRLLETIPTSDDSVDSLNFENRPVEHPDFRVNAMAESNQNSRVYYYALEHRTDGWWLIFSPIPTLETARVLVIKYIQAPPEVTKAMTFEDTGFEPFMLDAVIAYTVMRAREKEGDTDGIALAGNDWERKRTFALRAAGPKQTRDPEVVIGFLEDEIW